ncbi:MAG: hypothetical protein JKX91_01305 [Rhizobiaceae bacterium]|nr:hypothetical protein [Rhizobiaceae bacterium]
MLDDISALLKLDASLLAASLLAMALLSCVELLELGAGTSDTVSAVTILGATSTFSTSFTNSTSAVSLDASPSSDGVSTNEIESACPDVMLETPPVSTDVAIQGFSSSTTTSSETAAASFTFSCLTFS